MKRFIKLFSGSVVALHTLSCAVLTNPNEAQAFIRAQIDVLADWALFAAEQATLLNAL
jgi:hypothetical protein